MIASIFQWDKFCHSLALVILSIAVAGAVQAAEVTPQANRVAAKIDALDVENHWPVGMHVHWETGVPDGKPEVSAGKHTHCSAFVAAAAKLRHRANVTALGSFANDELGLDGRPDHRQVLRRRQRGS